MELAARAAVFRGGLLEGLRSGRADLDLRLDHLDRLESERRVELAGSHHLLNDVAASDELALDVELGNRGPRREGLDAVTNDVQKKLEARVEQTVKEFLKKADVVTSDELKALKKEVHQLKKMITSDAENASKQ